MKKATASKKKLQRASKKKTAHRKIADSPELEPLIVKLRQDWQNLGDIQLGDFLRDLVNRGCSLRGLASDLVIPETTLRRYMNFSSPPKPQPAAAKVQVSNKKASGRDAVRDPVGPSMELSNGMDRPAVEKPTMDLSDELADIILDFCKNAVPDEPIRDYDLSVLLREVKKCLGGEMWLTLASIQLPGNISWPELYRITRPPASSGDYWLAYRAIWLATIVKAKAPASTRETAFAKATQRAAELTPQPIPKEKQPPRIQRWQFVPHGFSPRNRR